MKIELERKNAPYHFEATNEAGNVVNIDSSPESGGQNKGARPMEMLLMAMAGCSSIDVIAILNKQKQDVKSYKVTIDGDREKDKIPSLFEKIHIHFALTGDLDEEKVSRAIHLSLDKYCSVAKTLDKTAEITSSYSINN